MPTLYDVSTVHVTVTDDNDNRPIITHPASQDNDTAVIQLTSSVLVGHVVTQVRASDADIGDNARLSYSIISDVIVGDVNGNVELFSIDKQSGEVTVASSLPESSHPVTYHVDVAVRDAGTPSLSSQTTLHIVVSDTPSMDVDVISRRAALSTTGSLIDVTWWVIAGGCVLAGLLVIATTSCLLVCVTRRRQRKRHARPNTATTTTTTTTTPRTASLSRRQVQAPAPLALMTDVDPLTSAMLRRHQFDDVTLLQQPAGFRTSGECCNYVNCMQNSASSGDFACKSAPVSTSAFCSFCNLFDVSLSYVHVCLSVAVFAPQTIF